MIRVIDFETTGLPPEGRICEAAYVDLDIDVDDSAECIRSDWSTLADPGCEIPIEAMAIHHIKNEDVRYTDITQEDALAHMAEGAKIFAAHNADFEKSFFDPPGAQWIDTYKIALRLWPDAGGHSNQFLRYWLDRDPGDKGMPPHRALPDCYVTASILLRMLEEISLNEALLISEQPPHLEYIPFGKHRGTRFNDAPPDYLQWIIRTGDFKPGVAEAAERALNTKGTL